MKLAEELIPIYNKMNEKYKISDQCEGYEEQTLTTSFIMLLESKNIELSKYVEDKTDYYLKDTKHLALLVIDLLMIYDKTLKLEIIEPEEMPMLSNWLAQSIGTTLNLPGYGLFY